VSAADRRPGIARALAWLGLAGLGALWAPQARVQAAAVATSESAGVPGASPTGVGAAHVDHDRGPGEEHPDDAEGLGGGLKGYTIGFGLALLLTLFSFGLPATGLVWGPAVPVALIVFALAQIGVHLVFFLHLTTGPDNTNNAMALAFGVLVVALVIGGSLWIMWHLDQNMLPMDQMMDMRR
jgi:cytochrome o ubiquinol oxidase subunit IV